MEGNYNNIALIAIIIASSLIIISCLVYLIGKGKKSSLDYKSRKFMMAISGILIITIGLFTGYLTETVFMTGFNATLALYFGVNWAEKRNKGIK